MCVPLNYRKLIRIPPRGKPFAEVFQRLPVQGRPVGSLFLKIPTPDGAALGSAVAFLERRGATTEVLGHV